MAAATSVATETNVYVCIYADCFYQILFCTAAVVSHSTKMDGGDRRQSPPSPARGNFVGRLGVGGRSKGKQTGFGEWFYAEVGSGMMRA